MKYWSSILLIALFVCGHPLLAHCASEGPRIIARQKQSKIFYRTPIIPYPYQARKNHIVGEGVIQVSFDEQGMVINVLMIKSTHSSVLDDAATKFAKAYWKSSPGNASTFEVPVEFTLSPPAHLRKSISVPR